MVGRTLYKPDPLAAERGRDKVKPTGASTTKPPAKKKPAKKKAEAGSSMKPTRRWRRQAEVYRHFARHWQARFDDAAAAEMFAHESWGAPLAPNNGFALGKKWIGVTLEAWKEDLRDGLLLEAELYEDPALPKWWLDRVLGDVLARNTI